MINPKIKICGISDIEILKQLIKLNLDYVGFIFYSKSPRFVDEVFLEKIQNIDFKETRPVCVYVNADEDFIYKTSSFFNNPILQFHGDEDQNFCETFGLDYWKAIRVKNASDIEMISQYSSASAILLENHKDGLYGGTGESFNWELLKNIDNDSHNFVLNSGVESQAGIKDIHLIKDILKTIRNYDI
ncbi:MAG: phosphoribosylanthranilate isomerase [Proteobacteria bacterium]|nr:phosphoribosylanthranilate isomerase [Pseudomonadota bacterium]